LAGLLDDLFQRYSINIYRLPQRFCKDNTLQVGYTVTVYKRMYILTLCRQKKSRKQKKL